MANKRNKKRQQRARRPDTAGQQAATAPRGSSDQAENGAPESTAAPVAPRAAAPARPASATASRYAGSVSGPRRGTAATSTGTIDIDERVPYFGRDLRRIVITAGVMLLIIVGASLLLH